MQKSDSGVWSLTVGPVEPNLYPYPAETFQLLFK